jgi:AhpC/TSA family
MPNGLTGDFEAAVEVSVDAVNRILATLHQAGASEEASPKFLHSITARVGDLPKQPSFDLAEAFLQAIFGAETGDIFKLPEEVLVNAQRDLVDVQRTVFKVTQELSQAISLHTATWKMPIVSFPVFFVVRGLVKAQLSTLSIAFPENSTSEVNVHCKIRALYIPDPGTVELPAPIHGKVKMGFEARYVNTGDDGPILEVKVTDNDNKISFTPAVGTSLTAFESDQISREIRRFLRTKFEAMTLHLDDDFPFRRFKALEAGGVQAIALPFNLSKGAHVPAFADFPGLFLAGNDDFAVALSSNYIKSLLQPALDQLREFSRTIIVTLGFPVPFPPFWLEETVVYHASVSNVWLGFQQGEIILTVKGSVTTNHWLADDYPNITIEQHLILDLDSSNQSISLDLIGGLSISGLPADIENKARDDLEQARDEALADVEDMIGEALKSVKFDDGLKPFDAYAKSKYTSLEIEPNGVILRGIFNASQRPSVVVDFVETSNGKALTAFKSWIPAGTVEKYVWSWVSRADPSTPTSLPMVGDVEHKKSIKHSFLFAPQSSGPPPGAEILEPTPLPWTIYQMCLQVEGTQYRATSGIANVSGGETCQIRQPEWLAIVPSWWDAVLLVPVWGPDPGPEQVVENAIVGHTNVRVESLPSTNAKSSSIIHFTDLQSEPALPVLGEALLRSKHKDSSVPVVVVLPRGSFQRSRSVLEKKLGSFPGELQVPLAVTEDYEESWTRAFNSREGSATYLLSGDGELVWKSQDQLDVAPFAAVLDEYVTVGKRRRSRVVRLAVRPGEVALDFDLEPGQGDHFSLFRLRGRRVVLLFWKSCSRPCLLELCRLQHVHNRASRSGTVIVGIADGEGAHCTAKIRREHQLGFALIPDPDRRISRQYAVNCWPTIVSINENGLVDLVRSGITHKREVPPEYSGASAASSRRF